jgi:phosphatidylglycerol:prolipoprotein diacylglycerol transferase
LAGPRAVGPRPASSAPRGRLKEIERVSMRPEIFRIPFFNLPIHGYGLMIVIGFLLTCFLANREARRRGLPEFVYDIGFVMLFTGILGGRLFYFIENYSTEFADRPWWAIFEIWKGGLVFYGGAIGGLLGGLGYLGWKRLPVGECLDTLAPFMPIGMGFGRLGCFLNGCCFGKVCPADFPLSLIFPKENKPGFQSAAFEEQLRRGLVLKDDPTALPVYPVQLYEVAYDFLLFALLYWFLRGPSPRRVGFPLLFIFYGIGRFGLEFLRGDNPETLTGLTISQNISLGLIAVFGGLLIYFWKKDLRYLDRWAVKKI